MGEPLFDSSGNQVFSGKGRKSRRFRELEAEQGLYRKEGEELISIHAATIDYTEIEKEIKAYLDDCRQNQGRDNCRSCKSWSIPAENWPNTRRGKCTRFDSDAKSSDKCDFFARPEQESEAEWWDNLDKKERDAIIAEHKLKRDNLKEIIAELEKLDDKTDYANIHKAVYRDDIGIIHSRTKAFSRKLERFKAVKKHGSEKKYSEFRRKQSEVKRVLLFKAAAEQWSQYDVKAGKKGGQPALRHGKVTKHTLGGMATYLKSIGIDVEVKFELGEGFSVVK